MIADVGTVQLVLLALAGLVGGVGITAVGPGGVLPTIALFLLTGLSPEGVAGTAIVTHIATGLLGTAVYARSGQLRAGAGRRCAGLLAATALVGTPLGVLLNSVVPVRGFGILLAAAVTATGLLVWLRERRESGAGGGAAQGTDGGADMGADEAAPPVVRTVVIGAGVAVAAGLFGIGGPMLSVPLLVVTGLPVLSALAAAQAQSVVIAAAGTVGYAVHGHVDWGLAALVGVPELAGVLIGWRIAHAVPARRLKYAMAAALFALAPYLAFHA